MGGTVANWSVASAADNEAGIGGAGVSQVEWSGCGRYLYAVERKSRGVLVYDVRVTGKLVAWLEGRDADTNQRMAVDVTANGEMWAGGTNGAVKSWRDVGRKEGAHAFDYSWQAYGDDTVVGGMSMHSCGSVMATASGSRRELALNFETDSSSDESSDDDDGNGSQTSRINRTAKASTTTTEDNSIKIWNLT